MGSTQELAFNIENEILSVIRSRPDGATLTQIARKLHCGMHRVECILDKMLEDKKITIGAYNRYVEIK